MLGSQAAWKLAMLPCVMCNNANVYVMVVCSQCTCMCVPVSILGAL